MDGPVVKDDETVLLGRRKRLVQAILQMAEGPKLQQIIWDLPSRWRSRGSITSSAISPIRISDPTNVRKATRSRTLLLLSNMTHGNLPMFPNRSFQQLWRPTKPTSGKAHLP